MQKNFSAAIEKNFKEGWVPPEEDSERPPKYFLSYFGVLKVARRPELRVRCSCQIWRKVLKWFHHLWTCVAKSSSSGRYRLSWEISVGRYWSYV
jgi:hypothetical protein